MGLGDEIMAAGQAQVLFEKGDGRRVVICDHHERPRWHPVWENNPIILRPEQTGRERVYLVKNDRFCRPYIIYPFTRDSGWNYNKNWRARDYRGRVYLTAEEEAIGLRLQRTLGRYAYIEPSVKEDSTTNKDWGLDRFAGVVLNNRDIPFVRVVHGDPRPLLGAMQFSGLTYRQAAGILKHAALYVGVEGGMHHTAMAFGVPAVVIFGGAIDVEVLGYPEHVNVVDTGPGSPCGSYLPCRHCAEALDRITVAHVSELARQQFLEADADLCRTGT